MPKLYLISLLSLLSFFKPHPQQAGHNTPATDRTFTITHFNILFAPDMSNRVNPALYKRPLNDVDLLSIITNDFYPSVYRFRRSENQKDKLMIDFINKGLINQYGVNTNKLFIDLARFHTTIERTNYVLARDPSIQTLAKDTSEMITEFTRMNNLAIKQNAGADIWNYLDQGIDEKRVLPAEAPMKSGNTIYINTYRNILILPTDGYIEALIFGKGYDLSKNTIDTFRKAYLKSGETNMLEFLKKNKRFQIKPVHNEYLKNMEILVMELYDRSLSKDGAATVHPTDMEIIKLFWTQWLQQSNVKRFELHPYANSKDEAEKTILNFLGVPKIS